MSRNHDLLFCKIAITNGLISQDVAQKALQLCDKRELESGRRPLIGAIFTKHNLIGKPDVQRLYTAVEKRLGTPAGPQLAAPPRGRGAKGKRAARAERRGKPTRPVDPKTLWMGIGGLVVFIGILGTILAMILMPGKQEGEATSVEGGGTTSPGSSGSPGSSTKKTPAGAVVAVPGSSAVSGLKEVTPDLLTQVSEGMSAIMDWRTDPEKVSDGLKQLEKMEQQLRGKGYEPPKILTARIAEFRQSMKELGVSGEAGESTPPGTETPVVEPTTPATGPTTPATGPSTPATGPSTPATGPSTPAGEPDKPAELPSVDDLDKELFGDL